MPELETSCHPDGLLELHLDEEARDNNSKNIAEFYIFNFESTADMNTFFICCYCYY